MDLPKSIAYLGTLTNISEGIITNAVVTLNSGGLKIKTDDANEALVYDNFYGLYGYWDTKENDLSIYGDYCSNNNSINEFDIQINTQDSSVQQVVSCEKKILDLHLEIEYDIFTKLNSDLVAVNNYVDFIFAQSSIIYQNDFKNNFEIVLTSKKIWQNSFSPFNGGVGNATNLMGDFYTNNPIAQIDLYHYIKADYDGGGIANIIGGYFNRRFDSSPGYYCTSPWHGTMGSTGMVDGGATRPYPDYSWAVMVFAHEMGHTLGSPHTHNCFWNGNNTTIDGCSGYSEGGCAVGPIPIDGGFICLIVMLLVGVLILD